jgi:hypothetical protein
MRRRLAERISVSCSSASCSDNGLPGELGIGDQLVEAADQFAHVAVDRAGKEFDHIGRHVRRAEAHEAVFEDLAAQFDIGRLDIGDKAHRQAREQPLLHPVQRLRRAVGGEDQPLAFGQQRIDRVEQFFLRAALPMMNWMSSTSSRSNPRSRALNSIIWFWRSAWTNSTMKRSAEQ